MIRLHYLPALLLCTLILFFACGELSSNPEGEPDDINEAKELWQSSNLSDYTMEVDRSCFCGGPLKFRATVQNGEIVEVTDLETGEKYNGPVGFQSIDDIFTWLEDVASKDPQKLELKFHSTLGYPTFIDYNQSDMIADEELLMKINNLETE